MKVRTDDVLPWLVMATVAVVIGVGAFTVVAKRQTEQRCLRAGYRDASVTWNLERYCVTRLDQTDVVVPLAAAEANPRKAVGR